MRGLGTVFVDHTTLDTYNSVAKLDLDSPATTASTATSTPLAAHSGTTGTSQSNTQISPPPPSQRQNMLYRQALIESIGLQLPRAAHLYLVVSPLSALHPQFDSVLSRILLQVRMCMSV